MKLYNKKIH